MSFLIFYPILVYFNCRFDHPLHLIYVKWFGKEIKDAFGTSFSFDIEAAVAGDDYDGKMGIYPLYKGNCLKSVHSRHVYVEDEDIDGFLENFSNRLRPAFHRLYLIALLLEDISQMIPEKFVVVGD